MSVPQPTMSSALAQAASGSPAASSAGSAAAASQSFLTPTNFFELLTAQLSHQDPLSPTSSTKFMSELAQLSSANGIMSLTSAVTGFQNASSTKLRLQAASMVGHDVGVSGNSIYLPASGGASGAYTLPSNASQVQVSVEDSSGAVVAKFNLGAQGAGEHKFSWSGSGLPAGQYQFNVQAVNASGNAVSAQPVALAKVASVQVSSSGAINLSLAGRSGTLPLDQVSAIF